MKQIILFTAIFLSTGFAMAQSVNMSTKNKYYKKEMVLQTEEYVNTAPITNSLSIIINAPIEKIWKVVDDTPNFTEWFPGVKSGSMINPNEKGLGAKRLAHLNSFKYYEEIVAYEPHVKWGFSMIESNSGACKSITEVIYMEAIDSNRTKVTYKGGYEYQGIYNWMKGMMTKQISKIWENALNGLKEHCE